jgi:hypothetical protein
MNNELREHIKILLLKSHMTMKELSVKMTEILGKKISQNNLSQKLGNESLRYDELIAICEILDYEIKLEAKK